MPTVAVGVWAGRFVHPDPADQHPASAALPCGMSDRSRWISGRAWQGCFPLGLTPALPLALLQGQVPPELHLGALQYSQAAVSVISTSEGEGP